MRLAVQADSSLEARHSLILRAVTLESRPPLFSLTPKLSVLLELCVQSDFRSPRSKNDISGCTWSASGFHDPEPAFAAVAPG